MPTSTDALPTIAGKTSAGRLLPATGKFRTNAEANGAGPGLANPTTTTAMIEQADIPIAAQAGRRVFRAGSPPRVAPGSPLAGLGGAAA